MLRLASTCVGYRCRRASAMTRSQSQTINWLEKASRIAAARVKISRPVRVVNATEKERELHDSLGTLGSTQHGNTAFHPHKAIDKPMPAPGGAALDLIVASGLHMGHHKRFHNRHAASFVYGRRNGSDIIDARQTLAALRRAAEVVRGVVEHDGTIVFMSALNGTEQAIRDAASACGPNGFAVTTYREGFLTNAEAVYEGYDFSALGASSSGEQPIPNRLMPSLLVLLTPRSYADAIIEANAVRIPTIGIIDSDTDPRLVTYPVPGNDDTPRGLQMIAGLLGRAGQAGLDQRMSARRQSAGSRYTRLSSRAEDEADAWSRQARRMRDRENARIYAEDYSQLDQSYPHTI